jgi:single-stranded-DNA-specific exonuclease
MFLGEKATLYKEQKRALNKLYENDNVMTIMGTGRGKSIVFQLYAAFLALKKNKNSIFVYPLKALINDQRESIRKFMDPLGITVRLANGDLSKNQKDELFNDMQNNQIDIVLATPEFLNYYKMSMRNDNIGFMVVDEGHYLARDRSGYKDLDKTIKYLNVEQVYITTATCPDKYFDIIKNKISIDSLVKDKHTRDNLKIIDMRNKLDDEGKINYLKKLLYTGKKAISYFNSKRQAMDTMEIIHKESPGEYKVGFYHGDMTRNERKKIEKWFKEGQINMIMATSAFGEGVNIKDIRHIVMYHPNFTTTDFNQQAGRGGRDGKKAEIHMIFNEEDFDVNESIVNIKFPREKLIYLVTKILQVKMEKSDSVVLDEKTIIHYCNKYLNSKKTSSMELNTVFKILEEAGVITFFEKEEDGENQYTIKDWTPVNYKPKILSKTPSYLEGKSFKEEYLKFKDFISNTGNKEILDSIQKPIFPSKKEEKIS